MLRTNLDPSHNAFTASNECINVEAEPIINYNTFTHYGLRFFDFCLKYMFVQLKDISNSDKYYHNKCFVESVPVMGKQNITMRPDHCTGFIEKVKTVASNISGESYHLFSVHGESLAEILKNMSNSRFFKCKLIENCAEISINTINNTIDTVTPSNSTSSINLIKENGNDDSITEIINDHPVIAGIITAVGVVGVAGAVVYHYINKPNSQQYSSTHRLIESSSTPATICKSRENACCLPNDAQDTRHSLFNSISHAMDVEHNNLPRDHETIMKKQQHMGSVPLTNNVHKTMSSEDDMYLHLYEEPNNHLYDVPNNNVYVVANEHALSCIRIPLNNNIQKVETNAENPEHDMYVDMTKGNKQLNNDIQKVETNAENLEYSTHTNMIEVDKQLELVFNADDNSVYIVGDDLVISS